MAKKLKIEIGKRYGSVIVLEKIYIDNTLYYRCKCDCGHEPNVRPQNLVKYNKCIKCPKEYYKGEYYIANTRKKIIKDQKEICKKKRISMKKLKELLKEGFGRSEILKGKFINGEFVVKDLIKIYK